MVNAHVQKPTGPLLSNRGQEAMIILFEQDRRGRFWWRPWRGSYIWGGKWSGRIIWGWWSVSWYRADGIKEFFDYIKAGNTEWRDGRRDPF